MIPGGIPTSEEVKWIFIASYLIPLTVGFILFIRHGFIILIFGFIGLLSGSFYNATPVFLACKGIGEKLVGLNFDILITLGGFVVQTNFINWKPILASIPISILVTLILWINQFQDREADRMAGKNYLVVRLGLKQSAKVYSILPYSAYIFTLIGIITNSLPSGLLLSS